MSRADACETRPALEEFYRSHVEAVQRFVARRVSDPHLAADLTAEGEREVLELVALEGMTTREVAATLAIKPVTARVRLHRARRTMQQLVSDPSKRPTSIAEARP